MIAFVVEGIGRSEDKFRPSYSHLHFHAKSAPQVSLAPNAAHCAARRFSKRCADVH